MTKRKQLHKTESKGWPWEGRPPRRPDGGAMTVDDWAEMINCEWRKSVAAIVNTGQLLIRAKKALGHGKWTNMVGGGLRVGKLDFQERVAQMIMRVAKNPVLSNPSNYSFLPPHYNTLHFFCGFMPHTVQAMIDGDWICASTTLADAKKLRGGLEHCVIDDFVRKFRDCLLFMEMHQPPDDELVERLYYELAVTLGEPLPVKEFVVSWFTQYFDRTEQLRLRRLYDGTNKTERDSTICYRDPDRACPDPLADHYLPPGARDDEAPPPDETRGGAPGST